MTLQGPDRYTQRVEAQAEWFLRQPSSGAVQELREFIHNSRANGPTLNASPVWITLDKREVSPATACRPDSSTQHRSGCHKQRTGWGGPGWSLIGL